MSDSKQPKFKTGDKVIVVEDTSAIGVEMGKVYNVKNPSSHKGSYNGNVYNYVTLEKVAIGSPNEDSLELYVEKPNYREMSPTDLIKISIDGNEAEVPLGDLVITQALIGRSTGEYGLEFYNYLLKYLGDVDLSDKSGDVIIFADAQKEVLDYFFKPYYDKQNEKAKLEELIESKSKELAKLKEKLENI